MNTIAIAGMAAVVLANSLVSASEAPKARPYAQMAVVPAKDQAQVNPLANDPNAVAAGRKLYDRHCASCHGAAGENGRKGPSLRVPEIHAASDGALFWVVTNGNVRAGMPVWSKLPEPQRWQAATYLKSLGLSSSETQTADPAPVR